MSTELIKKLHALHACDEAIEWAGRYATMQEAWHACERADWMCWLLTHLYPSTEGRVRLVLCACARTALNYVPAGEERPCQAIEVAERYARGNASVQELAAAWSAAWSAAGFAATKDMAALVRRMVPDPEHLPEIAAMEAPQ